MSRSQATTVVRFLRIAGLYLTAYRWRYYGSHLTLIDADSLERPLIRSENEMLRDLTRALNSESDQVTLGFYSVTLYCNYQLKIRVL